MTLQAEPRETHAGGDGVERCFEPPSSTAFADRGLERGSGFNRNPSYRTRQGDAGWCEPRHPVHAAECQYGPPLVPANNQEDEGIDAVRGVQATFFAPVDI